MKAIWGRQVWQVLDNDGEGLFLDDGVEDSQYVYVSFGSPGLFVDPTDSQIAAAIAGEPIPLDPDDQAEFAALVDGLGAIKPGTKEAVKRAYRGQFASEKRG